MTFQILVNIFIAVIWQFLQNSFTISSFITGFVFGMIILIILRGVLKFDLYLIKVWSVLKLILLFVLELLKANIDVIKVVLNPKQDHTPGIVAVETKLETDIEVTLLASLISLTPGTISMDFSDDGRTIYIHSIDVPDKEEMIKEIQDSFERAILEVTK